MSCEPVAAFLRAHARPSERPEQTFRRALLACHPDKRRGREAEACLVLELRAAYLQRRLLAPAGPAAEALPVPASAWVRAASWSLAVVLVSCLALTRATDAWQAAAGELGWRASSLLAAAAAGARGRARRSASPRPRYG
jgi:hypothetical protein